MKEERIFVEISYWDNHESKDCDCRGECGSNHGMDGACRAVDGCWILRNKNCQSFFLSLNFFGSKARGPEHKDPELVRLTVKTINDKPILLCQFCDKAITKAEKKKKKAEKSEAKRLASQDPLPFDSSGCKVV